MIDTYWQWIAANQPTNPRGQCATVTKRMAEAFPELRRVRGHYVCPLEGCRAHWWMETPNGQIIDPTQDQFVSCGQGTYEEYVGLEPTGRCLNCGEVLYGSEAFCNAACAIETAIFMNAGGRVYVNGQDITPAKD